MDWLPLFVRLRHRPVVVIGGGGIAERKIDWLIKAQADITVIAPEINADVKAWLVAGELQHVAAEFDASQLDQAELVIAATDDAAVNQAVAVAAKARQVLVNVVDTPDLCDFVFPSIVDRSPVVIAIGTGGKAPVLARQLKAELETRLPTSYGQLATVAGEWRQRVKQHIPTMRGRLKFWERFFDGPVAEHVLRGDESAAEQWIQQHLAASHAEAEGSQTLGEVYLVGGGPGNPDLLTFRALKLMQQCDVVLYDRLVSAEVLALVRRDAERINVGKSADRHPVPQQQINQLLIEHAQQGKRVLRLKGGDPFIFGRGGEEISELTAAGISFQVVPGITAANGCAAYAGIPLTHRDYSQSCVFVTGHMQNNELALNWSALAAPRQTVVFYMGVKSLPVITEQLIRHGLPASHPVAIVQQGTTSAQRVITGTLNDIAEQAVTAGIVPPSLTIVGEVVRCREDLAWYTSAAN